MKGNNIMNKLILSLAALSAVALTAVELPSNGGFEKCKAGKNGILMPEGWAPTKSQNKNASMQVTNDEDAPNSGKFAFDFEVEKGGQAFLTYWGPLGDTSKIKVGDKIKVSAFAKGTGSFQLAYILYGIPEGGKIRAFMWTAVAGKFKVNNEDKYQKFEKTVSLQSVTKNGKKHTNVTLLPVIIVNGDSTILLDDYSIAIEAPTVRK